MTQPIVWTVAGSDCSSGAGVQADLKTCEHFEVHCCSIITLLTAQNTQGIFNRVMVDKDFFSDQITACAEEFMPTVIKSGVIGSKDQVIILSNFLEQHPEIFYVCDPVIMATSGAQLCDDETLSAIKNKLLPRANLVTPNIIEINYLLGSDDGFEHKLALVQQFLNQFGSESVLLKGGDIPSETATDIWLHKNGEQLELTLPKINSNGKPFHGTGCTLSSAIAANIAKGESIQNALVIAKQAIYQAISYSNLSGIKSNLLSWNSILHREFKLPKQVSNSVPKRQKSFPKMEDKMGFYPIVDSSDWIEKLCQWGVKTIQLRIKQGEPEQIESEIKKSISIAERNNVKLFINDYWQLAIKYQAYGVHLGQEDIETADLLEIQQAGIRLGVSTHDFYELGRALQIQPSYIALGPIYHTTSKEMRFMPQGLEKVRQWKQFIKDIPLVAIGGIEYRHMQSLYENGADSISVISYVTRSENPKASVISALSTPKSI